MFTYTEAETLANYIVQDFGVYKRHIYFEKAIRKKGFEECGNDVIEQLESIECSNGFADKKSSDEEIRRVSTIRAKNKIHAMALMNSWGYFVTFTFDPKRVDSKNKDEVFKTILKFIKNVLTKNEIKYLLIPEYHADKKKIHFHGFLKDSSNHLKLTETNKKSKNGYNIYNITNWRYGFNTAVKIDSEDRLSEMKIASYCMKYITKSNERIFDRYYFCSKGLINSPRTVYKNEVPDYENWYFNGYCYIYDEEIKM